MTGNLGDHHLFLLGKNDDGILNEVTSMSFEQPKVMRKLPLKRMHIQNYIILQYD